MLHLVFIFMIYMYIDIDNYRLRVYVNMDNKYGVLNANIHLNQHPDRRREKDGEETP
jgi:hypothetical protein